MPADVDVTLLLIVAMVLGVPILGITARMAIQPVVEALLQLKEVFGESPVDGGFEGRLSRLEEEVERLSISKENLLAGGDLSKTLPPPDDGDGLPCGGE